MQKRVLILHPHHWDQLMGGAEQQLKNISEYLLDNNFEVYFLGLDSNKNTPKNNKIKHHLLKGIKIRETFGVSLFRFKEKILKTVKEINPDIIITRTYTSWAGIIAKYALKENKGHIHFIGSDNEVVRYKQPIPIYKFLNKVELKWFLKIFNENTKVVTQNKFQNDTIRKAFAQLTITVTQGTYRPQKIQKHKATDDVMIVWVGNFKSIKRPDKFLEVVNCFKDKPNIRFVMMGRYSSIYDDLLKEYRDIKNFDYIGEVTQDKVNEYLDKAHILLNTSDYEGFSNTFIQAWHRGVVVLSLNSDPDNILESKNIGFKTNTIENTILIIQQLIANKEMLKDYSNRSISYSLANHSIPEIYKPINKFLFESNQIGLSN